MYLLELENKFIWFLKLQIFNTTLMLTEVSHLFYINFNYFYCIHKS